MLKKFSSKTSNTSPGPVIGVFTPCDPRVDQDARARAANIVRLVAEAVAAEVKLPNGEPFNVVYSEDLVDGEAEVECLMTWE